MVELSYPEYPRASFLTKLRIKGTLMDPKVSPDKLALLKTGALVFSSLATGPVGLPATFVTPLLKKSQYPLAHAKNRHPADNGHH